MKVPFKCICICRALFSDCCLFDFLRTKFCNTYTKLFLCCCLQPVLWLYKAFFGNALFAQAKNFTKKIDTSKSLSLKEVSVRSVRLSSRNTSPAPVQILRGAALEKLNGISVADAIRFFSGVQLKDYGGVGGLKTIDVSTPSFFISGLYSVY